MSGWLIDTNVLSELRRPRPKAEVAAFISVQPLEDLYVSAVTFAEIRFGVELVPDAARRSELALWLENQLRPMFDGRVLPVTEDILLKWRLIIEDGRRRGHTFAHPDVLIAATAARHGLTVVSRDESEFAAAGVAIFNPWTGVSVKVKP
jgi:toxin FitB